MHIELIPKKSTSSYLYNSNKQPLKLTEVDPDIAHNLLSLTCQTPLEVSVQFSTLKRWHSLIYLDPFSRRSVVWNIIVMLIIYILELQISLALGLGPRFVNGEIANTTYFVILYYSMIAVLIVDVFLNFHKGYYAFGKGKVIDDQRHIVLNYMKFYFWVDIICIGVMIILIPTNAFLLNFLQLVPAVLLWIKKFHYQQQVIQFLQYNKNLRIIFILVVLGIDVMMIGNIGACLFLGIDLLLWELQYYGSNTVYYWLSNDTEYSVDLIGGSWYLQYTYAQSFSSGTLSTLAPGPFGKNPIQIFYAIIVMTFFMFLASYAGQVLVSILYVDQQKRVFHQSNIQKFDQFMTLKNVSTEIKARIHNFFQLIWEIEVKMDTKVKQDVINKLPINLKEKLMSEINFAKYIPILKHLPNSSMLENLIVPKITQVVLDSNTCIYTAGSAGVENYTRSIFYLKEGMAQFYFSSNPQPNKVNANKEHLLALTNVEKLLGCYQFLTGQGYQTCCRVIDLCIVDRLTFADFLQVLTINDLLEQFYLIKDQVLIERNFSKINKNCVICMGEHRQTECPELFIKYDRRERMNSLGFSRSRLKRKQYKRRSHTANKKVVGLGIYSGKEGEQFKNRQQDKNLAIKNVFEMFHKFTLMENPLWIAEQDLIDSAEEFKEYHPEHNIHERIKRNF